MTAKDIFGVILRSAAVYIFIWGAWNLLAMFIAVISKFLHVDSSPWMFAYFSYGISGIAGGVILFFSAPWIERIAYPSKDIPPKLPHEK